MQDNYYETRYKFNKDRAKVWRAICEYLQKYISKNATVLDLGCGYGDFINNISASKKIALDVNDSSAQYCNKNVIFIKSYSNNLNKIKNKSLDVVFSSNLFEHLTDTETIDTINEIKRVLKKNGRLILIQPNFKYCYRDYFDDYTHKKIYSHISLNDQMTSFGFKTQVIIPRFLPFSFKSILPKSYFITKLYLNLPYKPLAKQMLLIFEKHVEQ